MDSVREKIAQQLQKPKLNIDLICEILKEMADAIDAPKKKASTSVKKKAAPAPAPAPAPTPEPVQEPVPEPVPEPIESGAVFTDRESLDTAIAAWIDNETSATETYGDINTWDVRQISDFSALF